MILFVMVVMALAVACPEYFVIPRERLYVLSYYTYAERVLPERGRRQ